MIGKCKAIAHGSTALDYIFREGKLGNRLLESVAGSIVEAVSAAFPMISSIDLKLLKLNPPMGADSDGAGVELHLINDKTKD